MAIEFTPPTPSGVQAQHHQAAAAGNAAVAKEATATLKAVLAGEAAYERILLKAAAGAGKSRALQQMVATALQQPNCIRVGITAFANKQLYPLARHLGEMLGRDKVCLHVTDDRAADIDDALAAAATVVHSYGDTPADAQVIISTSHMFEGTQKYHLARLGPAANGERLFDVLFIDEAWQLPLHRYRRVDRLAPLDVGVGDVGQLPPLDPGQNPWRGDRTYNPYRAWPTQYPPSPTTWVGELPAVWRPTAAQRDLWHAFYGDWERLDCVAAPGDRRIELGAMADPAASIWSQVATGVPTLVEVDGLDEPDAPDIDPPLLACVEEWLDQLLTAGFTIHSRAYDADGAPGEHGQEDGLQPGGDPRIAVLATRNQAVDDAQEMVDRLVEKHGLDEGVLVASTVDSWQGQTNAITVAIHPLSGASALDDFNSAFGRLAVTCTRATHGLLLVSRSGLGDLLSTAPARPGTPLGEPGTRQLPRQTHERILRAFAEGEFDRGSA